VISQLETRERLADERYDRLRYELYEQWASREHAA
jgi:hypothetical protein